MRKDLFMVLERLVYGEDDWLAVRRDLFMVWKDWFTVRMTGSVRKFCLWSGRTGLQ